MSYAPPNPSTLPQTLLPSLRSQLLRSLLPLPFLDYRLSPLKKNPRCCPKPFVLFEASTTSKWNPNSDPDPRPTTDPSKPKGRRSKPKSPVRGTANAACSDAFPSTIPSKQRRSRRSEVVVVEAFTRDRLEQTFTSIWGQNAEVLEGKEEVLKQRTLEEVEGESSEGEDGGKGTESWKRRIQTGLWMSISIEGSGRPSNLRSIRSRMWSSMGWRSIGRARWRRGGEGDQLLGVGELCLSSQPSHGSSCTCSRGRRGSPSQASAASRGPRPLLGISWWPRGGGGALLLRHRTTEWGLESRRR